MQVRRGWTAFLKLSEFPLLHSWCLPASCLPQHGPAARAEDPPHDMHCFSHVDGFLMHVCMENGDFILQETITCVDDRVATIVFAEQNVLAITMILENVSNSKVVVDNHSICKQKDPTSRQMQQY